MSYVVCRVFEQVGGQSAGCAFAVGACYADYLCRAKLEEDVYLGRDKSVCLAGNLKKLIIDGYSGIRDDNICLLEISRGVRAEMKFDAAKVL